MMKLLQKCMVDLVKRQWFVQTDCVHLHARVQGGVGGQAEVCWAPPGVGISVLQRGRATAGWEKSPLPNYQCRRRVLDALPRSMHGAFPAGHGASRVWQPQLGGWSRPKRELQHWISRLVHLHGVHMQCSTALHDTK